MPKLKIWKPGFLDYLGAIGPGIVRGIAGGLAARQKKKAEEEAFEALLPFIEKLLPTSKPAPTTPTAGFEGIAQSPSVGPLDINQPIIPSYNPMLSAMVLPGFGETPARVIQPEDLPPIGLASPLVKAAQIPQATKAPTPKLSRASFAALVRMLPILTGIKSLEGEEATRAFREKQLAQQKEYGEATIGLGRGKLGLAEKEFQEKLATKSKVDAAVTKWARDRGYIGENESIPGEAIDLYRDIWKEDQRQKFELTKQDREDRRLETQINSREKIAKLDNDNQMAIAKMRNKGEDRRLIYLREQTWKELTARIESEQKIAGMRISADRINQIATDATKVAIANLGAQETVTKALIDSYTKQLVGEDLLSQLLMRGIKGVKTETAITPEPRISLPQVEVPQVGKPGRVGAPPVTTPAPPSGGLPEDIPTDIRDRMTHEDWKEYIRTGKIPKRFRGQ